MPVNDIDQTDDRTAFVTRLVESARDDDWAYRAFDEQRHADRAAREAARIAKGRLEPADVDH